MRKLAVIAGCVVVAAVALYVSFFRSTEEDRIRAVLTDLAKVVAVKNGDTILSRTARVRSRMKDLVDEDVRVNVAELAIDVRGRKSFEDDAARAGLVYQQADCEFSDVTIRVDPQASLAQVDAVALVAGQRGGERKVDKRAVHFLLRKDGDWRITTIDVAAAKKDEDR